MVLIKFHLLRFRNRPKLKQVRNFPAVEEPGNKPFYGKLYSKSTKSSLQDFRIK